MTTRLTPNLQPQRSTSGNPHRLSVARSQLSTSSYPISESRRTEDVIDLTKDGDKALTIATTISQDGLSPGALIGAMGSHEITVNAGMVSDREYGQRNGQAKPETSAEGSLSIALASSQGSSAPIRDAYEDASRLAITASAQLPARPGRHGNEHASKSNSMTSTNYEMKQDRAVEALAIQTPHEATRFPSGSRYE